VIRIALLTRSGKKLTHNTVLSGIGKGLVHKGVTDARVVIALDSKATHDKTRVAHCAVHQ
jgi:hypothetical protein